MLRFAIALFAVFILSLPAHAQEKTMPPGSVGAEMQAPVAADASSAGEAGTSVPAGVMPTPMPEANESAVPSVTPVPADGSAPAATQSAEPAQMQPGELPMASIASPDDTVKAMAYAYKYYTEGDLQKALDKLKEAEGQVSSKLNPPAASPAEPAPMVPAADPAATATTPEAPPAGQ